MKDPDRPTADSRCAINVDRRTFMGTMACAGAGIPLGALPARSRPAAAAKPRHVTISLDVKGVAHEFEHRGTLLEASREFIGIRVHDLPVRPYRPLGA